MREYGDRPKQWAQARERAGNHVSARFSYLSMRNGNSFGYRSAIIAGMNEEIYPNAPIVLMVAEIKHTEHDPLDEKQARTISEAVKETLPLSGETTEWKNTVIAPISNAGAPQIQTNQTTISIWSSRDKRTILTVKPDSISVETTRYVRYENVRLLLKQALTALGNCTMIDGVTRIGLRYIDEIRVPSDDDSTTPDWKEWVNGSLLGPTDVKLSHVLTPVGNEGTSIFSGDSETHLVLRYGAQQSGYAVNSTPQLKRPMPAPGPFFKLDIDSYWQPETIPEFSTPQILDTTDKLHEPVRSMFEQLITDRLRKEVLRHE